MRLLRFSSVVLAVVVMGCGPGPRGDDGDDGDDDDAPMVDADPSSVGGVRGRVWAPNQGPGQVLPGEEIPIYGAAIYLTTTRPAPIPEGVYCQPCQMTPAGTVVSGPDGSFELSAVEGQYILVIEKAQFRIERSLSVVRGMTIDLPSADTTLASVHDPVSGSYIPKIAVAIGSTDRIEDILGKIGLGDINTSTWAYTGGGTEVDLYSNSFTSLAVVGDATTLLSDINRMRDYHIIFFPCSTSTSGITVLSQPAVLENIRRYVNEGGKLYVTDWSGEVMDRPFPPQIQLGDFGADSTGSYDPVALTGTVTSAGDADGSSYTSQDAEAVDGNLLAWINTQSGPTPGSAITQPFNGALMQIVGNWNWIVQLTTVMLGIDPDTQLPVYDEPKTWVIGSGPATGGMKKPLSVSFQPTGCGRVTFSTYQTANGSHPGLYPQERIMLYLIMEIGTCSDVIIIE